MKILHFSDTHLGFSDLDLVNAEGINQREADFYDAFSQVIDAVVSLRPDYVIHTGDLFHRASPSNRAITFALHALKRIERLGIPLILIAGNHSTPRTKASSPILEALQTLDNVTAVFGQAYERVAFDEVIFHALPHIHDERIIEGELEKLEIAIDATKKNILMMHCSVGAHYLMHEFGEWVFPKEKEYLFAKMDYVALGHWHGFGAVGKHPNVYYSGSTERTSGSDKREDKGYVLIDLDGGLEVRHECISVRKSLSFLIDATHYEQEIAALDLSGIKDALVEVTLTHLTPTASIDITNRMITEHFKEALYVKVKREFETKTDEAISDDLAALSLEGFFVAHIAENINETEEQVRLVQKSKALFALCEERDDDTL